MTATKSVRLWVFAGTAPVAVAAFLSSAFAPHPLAPGSLAAILPALLASTIDGARGGQSWIVVPEVAVLIYLFASIPLLVGSTWAWDWSVVVFALALLSDAAYFANLWSLGVQYQGRTHTYSVFALNVVGASLVGLGLFRARGQRSSRSVVLCHVALFCWIEYACFPWLGEMF